MNKRGSADKIKLSSFDDLFGTQEAGTGTEQVQEIPLCELHEFRGHPFKVVDDEKMQETVESIKNYGVLMPGIARPRAEGGYEIIAGHRRRHGCELAGLSTMPMFVRDYTDDEATIIMVDTNIQREDILPSEKARAYSMKYEAMKHQGKKGTGNSLDEVGEAAGESARRFRGISGFLGYLMNCWKWLIRRKSVWCRALIYRFLQSRHRNGCRLSWKKPEQIFPLSNQQN